MNNFSSRASLLHEAAIDRPEMSKPTRPERLDLVRRADWGFADEGTKRGIHSIHPYPARFIPQIPRQLIEILHPGDGSAVLDPFCGSGTTLVEAQGAGHPAIGIDLNPIATLIARAKTRRPTQPILPLARKIVSQVTSRRVLIPPIPRIDHWFERDVQEALARLVNGISKMENVPVREALQVALSGIVVRVSNQDSDTRYAAVRKRTSAHLVYELFTKAAGDIDRSYQQEFDGLFSTSRPEVKVITRDILQVNPQDIGARVGLVVTSPPYPNAYEYWLYHKYRMYWLGMEPLSVRAAELGARPHYFKKNHQTEADFEKQIRKVFALLAAVTTHTALVCFLVGRSIIHGRRVDNAALVERAALPSGLHRLLTLERKIPRTRKAFNPVLSPIEAESLLIFGR